jgi:hypothetical protein
MIDRSGEHAPESLAIVSILRNRRPAARIVLPPVSARERVLERRDVRQAVEFEFLLIVPFLLAEAAYFGPGSTLMLAACLGSAAAMGLLALLWLRAGLRRNPYPAAFTIGIIIVCMGGISATTSADVAFTMVGMFGVVTVGCAAWMPWPPRWHLGFLAMSVAGLVVAVAACDPAWNLVPLAGTVGLTAVITSLAGHWLIRQHRRRAWLEALRLRAQRAELRRALTELREAERTIRRLEGVLPICAACKRVRDGEHWERLESYLATHSEAEVSHGICPECAARLYGSLAEAEESGAA